MIHFDFERMCYQCGICKTVCKSNAIEYIDNREGGFYPRIDTEKCIRCGLCEARCPRVSPPATKHPERVYAARSSDLEGSKRSSSGGIFWELAKDFIAEDKYVCGCVFNKQMQAEHILSNQLSDVERMQGSKYVKSSTEKVIAEMQQCLKKGNRILFCGTPCQVAAMEKQFEKYRDQLYLVGLFCHGIPPQKVLDIYIRYLERNGKKVENIIFRGKERKDKEHIILYQDGTKEYHYKNESGYMNYFWSGILLHTCEDDNCQYKKKFAGDIMIGDAWGYHGILEDRNFQKRVSYVLPLTEKGNRLLQNQNLLIDPDSGNMDIREVYQYNPYLLHGFKKNNQRNEIISVLNEKNWKKVLYRYKLRNPMKVLAYRLGLYSVLRKMKEATRR